MEKINPTGTNIIKSITVLHDTVDVIAFQLTNHHSCSYCEFWQYNNIYYVQHDMTID